MIEVPFFAKLTEEGDVGSFVVEDEEVTEWNYTGEDAVKVRSILSEYTDDPYLALPPEDPDVPTKLNNKWLAKRVADRLMRDTDVLVITESIE